MIAPTAFLGVCAEYALINADVAIIAEMRLNDVIQINATRRPLRQHRRRQPKRCNGRNKHRQDDTDATRQATIFLGSLRATGAGGESSSALGQATHSCSLPVLASETGGP